MRGSRRSSTQPGSGWKLSETDTRVCGFARLGRPSERSLVLQGSLPDEWPTLAGELTHGSVALSIRNGPHPPEVLGWVDPLRTAIPVSRSAMGCS